LVVNGANPIIRKVASARCDDDRIMLSAFGETGGALELMARRRNAPGWNYYALKDKQWTFFGSSIDLMDGPGQGGVRSCATCHPSGALVMKELEDPWVNWTPGFRAAEAMENGVRFDVDELAPLRVNAAAESKTVVQLLEPLFCTTDFNLTSLRGLSSFRDFIPLATRVLSSVSPGTLHEDGEFEPLYLAALETNNQRLEVAPGQPLLHAEDGSIIRDTASPLIFPHEAAADSAYIDALTDLVPERLIDAARMADFTRPVFSDRRCALLEHAPAIAASEASPEAIVDGFRSSLEAKGELSTTEEQFLADLTGTDEDVAASQRGRLEDLATACRALSDEAFVAEVLAAASVLRSLTRRHPLAEFRELLPVDDLGLSDDARLDPTTCKVE
jgi:hypothetical protein